MKNIKFLIVSLLILYTTSSLADSNWVLNGAAKYQELNKTLYIGGLYLKEPSEDPSHIFSASTNKKMRIIVKSDQWSKRKWASHWRQRIAVNPNTQNNSASREDLDLFVNVLQESLLKNDEIVVAYTSGKTVVLLNGEQAIKSVGSGLIDSLLKTWLAEVPPSSEFKNSILQSASKKSWIVDRSTFESHTIAATRKTLFSSWVLAERKKREAEREAEKKKQEDRIAQEKIAQEKLALDKKFKAEEELRAKVEKVKVEKQRLQELSEYREQEQKYFQRLLQWQFQRYADRHVSRILKKNPSYDYRKNNDIASKWVSFSFDRNRITQDFQPNDNLKKDKLALSAIEKSIKAATQHISIPATLRGNTWTISVEYRNAKRLVKIAPPPKPENISAHGFSNDVRISAVDEYKNYLLGSVQDAIPVLENYLTGSRENRLKLKVTVDRWGEIKAIDFLRKPKNPYSVGFFQDKLEVHSPFRVLPEETAQNEFSVEIDYQK